MPLNFGGGFVDTYWADSSIIPVTERSAVPSLLSEQISARARKN